MRRSFTLLEGIVVLLILAILITIGVSYFGITIERSRVAEARSVLKQIREEAIALCLQYRCSETFTDTLAGIGLGNDPIPGPTAADCTNKHYFWYRVGAGSTAENFTATAVRCTAGGKQPNSILPRYLRLVTNLTNRTDKWESDGNY